MSQFFCDGLRAENPIGAMAALGLLRVCARRRLFGEAKLCWRAWQGSWRAVLHTEEPTAVEQLARALSGVAAEAEKRPELNWAGDVKSAKVDVYVRQAAEALGGSDSEAIAWFSALGADLVADEGILEPTPFDMTVARQRFLSDALKLSSAIAGQTDRRGGWTPLESFREALLGPWLYRDDQHSLGWDPLATRLGAFTHKEPSKMANEGVRAVVWLAFQSLPLFPCCCSRRSLATRGWVRSGREREFVWPVWTAPVGLAAVECLLGLAELIADDPMRTLRRRGVVAVYSSRRMKPNKYMTSFDPATARAGSLPPSSGAGR